jgi:CRISPR-associated protein Csb2
LAQAVRLVASVRDRTASRLKKALPEKAPTIERVFIGCDATEADKAARIRIVPLPSIGSPHVARAIRRVLVEVPPNCPLAGDDIGWAFSGLDLNVDYETGEVSDQAWPILVAADDGSMLRHYGVDDGSAGHRVWRTVTPAALPEQAARRRIDPRRLREELAAARNNSNTEFKEAKPGRERLAEQHCAISAVVQALRHAGVAARPETIRVQREPFEGRGARAEAFAPGTRFAKERLWHIKIAFAEPQRGLLAVGDGRYLGLGLMVPVPDASRDAVVFAVPVAANVGVADGPALVRAARRALMALASNGDGRIPRLFSGHEPDGRPASSGQQEHIFLAADDNDGDGRIDRLIVAAPWTCDRSLPPDGRMRKTFDGVVSRLAVVRAGRFGVITLGPPRALAGHDPLIGPARVWQSRTPYRATRHAGRRKDPAEALARDLVSECLRRGLPRPKIDVLEFSAVPNGGGLLARARLHFAPAIRGPLLLGRDSHQGGGLFSMEG